MIKSPNHRVSRWSRLVLLILCYMFVEDISAWFKQLSPDYQFHIAYYGEGLVIIAAMLMTLLSISNRPANHVRRYPSFKKTEIDNAA